jgi:hypothetical protein
MPEKRKETGKEPEKYTYELALLRDIRTLLAFLLERDIGRGKPTERIELDNWILAYIKENRIL